MFGEFFQGRFLKRVVFIQFLFQKVFFFVIEYYMSVIKRVLYSCVGYCDCGYFAKLFYFRLQSYFLRKEKKFKNGKREKLEIFFE